MVTRLKTKHKDLELHKELTPGNCYRVISIEREYVRILSDDGRPGLYKCDLFDVVYEIRPGDWIVLLDDQGEVWYEGPKCFASPGFWEDCYDDEPRALCLLRSRLAEWAVGEDRVVNEG